MPFDIAGAKKAGYSDAEIANYLAQQKKFDANGARKAGYSDAEILGYLQGTPPPAAVDVSSLDKQIAAKQAELAQAQTEGKAQMQAMAQQRPELAGPASEAIYEHRIAAVQQDLAALQRLRADSVKKGQLISAPTAGQVALEAVKAPVRGAIRGVEDVAGLAGVTGATGEKFAKIVKGLGESAISATGLGADENLQYSGAGQRVGQFGETVGGLAPFLATEGVGALGKSAQLAKAVEAAKAAAAAGESAEAIAAAGKAAAASAKGARAVAAGAKTTEAAMATGMGATQAREQMDQYEQATGQQIDPLKRQAIEAGGAILGAPFMLPIGGIMRKVAPELATATQGKLAGILADLGESKIGKSEAVTAAKGLIADVNKTAAGRVITQGVLPAATVMGGMQFGQNVLASSYNPNQDLTQGVGEAALMGGLGVGAVHGGVEALSRIRSMLPAKKQVGQGDLNQQKPLQTADVVIPNPDDPTQKMRDTWHVLTPPDTDGNILVRTGDNQLVRMSAQRFDSFKVPEEGHNPLVPSNQNGGVSPIAESFSKDNLKARLANAAGETITPALSSYVDALHDKIYTDLALDRPKAVADYITDLEKNFSGARRKRAANEFATNPDGITDPKLRVLFEAKSILNDYRAEYGRQLAQPGVDVGRTGLPTPAESMEQMLQRTADEHNRQYEVRHDLLDRVATDPDITDKHAAFEAALQNHALDPMHPDEANALRDVMKSASEQEAAAGATKNAEQGARDKIVESFIGKTHFDPEQKVSLVNNELMRARMEPLDPREEADLLARAEKRDNAAAVFGPNGEYAAREVAPNEPVEGEEAQPETVEGVPVTKVAPGVARGVTETRRGQMGTNIGRPVEGAAELTGGMQEEQELNKRLNVMRNNNLISDQDVGEVLNMVRVPTTKADFDALPESQRQRWKDAIDKQLEINQRAEEHNNATNPKQKKKLKESLDALTKQLDDTRGNIAKAAQREAQARVTKRQEQRRQIDAAYKAGEITKAERDQQVAALRVQSPTGPLLAEGNIQGARTESAKRSLDVAQRTGSAHEVLKDLAQRGGPLGEIAARLLKIAPDVKVEVVDPETLRAKAGGKDAEAAYVPGEKTIYLSSEMSLDHAPVHEVIHAALDGHIERGTAIGKELQDIYRKFNELASPEQREAYGFKDAHEFVAEALGNPDFRAELDLLMPKGAPKSLLGRMIDAVKRMFGAGKTAHDYVERMMSLAEEAGKAPVEGTEPRAILGDRPEETLKDNPNHPKEDTAGLMAKAQQWLKRMLPSQSTITRKLNYKYQDAVDYDRWLAHAYGVDRLPPNMSVDRKAALYEAQKSNLQAVLDHNYVRPMLKKIADLGLDMQDVGMYLWARSAPARNAMVRERNSRFPESGSGMNDAESDAILKDFARRGLEPQLEQIAKMHDRLVDHMLNTQVKEGLLTRKQADAARAEQPMYASLKGYAADGDMQTEGDPESHTEAEYNKQLGIRRSEYMKSGGRKSMPFNPLVNLVVDAQRLMQRVAVNRVGKAFIDNVLTDPGAHEDVAKVYTEDNPKVRYKPVPNSSNPEGIPVRANMRTEADNYLVVKKDGVAHYVEFADTEAGQAMKRMFNNMTPAKMTGFMRAVTITSNALKSLDVRRSPAFALRAFIRDPQEAVLNAYTAQTEKGGPAEGKQLAGKVAAYLNPVGKTGALINSSITRYLAGMEPKNEDQAHMMLVLDQMLEDGGSQGHTIIRDTQLLATDAEKYVNQMKALKDHSPVAIAKAGIEGIGKVTEATARMVELRTRLATYVAALEEGIDREGAAHLALSSYLDLTRRGEWANIMDNLWWFSSPKIETARRVGKMLTHKNGLKAIATLMGVGAALSMWNMWLGSDDDDHDGKPNWMDVSEHDKQYDFVIRTGRKSDDYVKFPMGFIAAPFVYAGGELTEYAHGKMSAAAASVNLVDTMTKLGKDAEEMFSPVAPHGRNFKEVGASAAPSLVAPLAQVGVNRTAFGSPIYNEQFNRAVAASKLGRDNTGEGYKWLAKTLNDMSGGSGHVAGAFDLQPEAYKHVVQQYGGGVFRLGQQAYDATMSKDKADDRSMAQRMPIIGSYVGQGGKFAPMNNYYNNIYSGPAGGLEGLAYQQLHYPDEFGKSQSRYPIETDQRVLDAYRAANSQLEALGKAKHAADMYATSAAERNAALEEYRNYKNEVYRQFNAAFNAASEEHKRK